MTAPEGNSRKVPPAPEPFLRDLRAGHSFFFSHGDYSDYSVDGFFLPLEDIPAMRLLVIAAEVQAKWKEEDEKNGWAELDCKAMLIPELIRRGLLLEITAPEIHLDGWDELRIVFEKDRK